ncbi:hypothetical protein LIER_34764 [Lithospermum erythrorhizon]|uniref:Uncharacterized protein n=1 Tax=Lithospermum erythrorhizon TaxID=34254 RepID=A0AAV3S0E0_LITER
MKKKKKRKCPPPEEDASMLVASNADPSLLLRVPNNNRVNVDNVFDENLQNVVAEWGRNSPSHAADGSSVRQVGNGVIGAGQVAPQHSYVVALSYGNETVPQCENGDVTQDLSKITIAASIAPQTGSDATVNTGTGVVVQGKDGDKNDTVPVFRPCDEPGSSSGGPNKSPLAVEGLLFKAGGSGFGSVPNHVGSFAKGTKAAGRVHQRARPVLSRGSGVGFGAGHASNCPNQPTTQPICPGAAVPLTVPDGPPEGAKVCIR